MGKDQSRRLEVKTSTNCFPWGNKDEMCKLLGHSVVLDLCLSKTILPRVD